MKNQQETLTPKFQHIHETYLSSQCSCALHGTARHCTAPARHLHVTARQCTAPARHGTALHGTARHQHVTARHCTSLHGTCTSLHVTARHSMSLHGSQYTGTPSSCTYCLTLVTLLYYIYKVNIFILLSLNFLVLVTLIL